jgi:hypothetical protein
MNTPPRWTLLSLSKGSLRALLSLSKGSHRVGDPG